MADFLFRYATRKTITTSLKAEKSPFKCLTNVADDPPLVAAACAIDSVRAHRTRQLAVKAASVAASDHTQFV